MNDSTYSVIDLPKFIQATRDSGYRSTASAIAELVDNSIEAGATRVQISIVRDESNPNASPTVQVADNGAGMSPKALREALRFGGSSRFGARNGLGRFGMGLPNASLSQSRRVEVRTWTGPRSCWQSHLDVDEIAKGRMSVIPEPARSPLPTEAGELDADTGTLVAWTACDRLDNRRISTIERKVMAALGRIFRHFIWNGVRIVVNGKPVQGLDPLYLHKKSPLAGASPFGDTLEFRVRNSASGGETGNVKVTFSELPVEQWAGLSVAEKRERGISNGAGVSVVRGGREIDYGWFFMGGKRRENYDDWWRCEVQFEPVLDEAFGITHTKQEIRPSDHLVEALSGELEEIAKALNARARNRYSRLKSSAQTAPLELKLERQNEKLPSLPARKASPQDAVMLRSIEDKLGTEGGGRKGPIQYRIVEEDQPTTAFFRTISDGGRVVIVLNTKHILHRNFYSRLAQGEQFSTEQMLHLLHALLLGAGRAEAMASRKADQSAIQDFREHWGKVMDVLLNGR